MVIPKKSDLGKSKKRGQSEKIDKSVHRLNIRITDIEFRILEELKKDNKDFNVSDFIKNLILDFDIDVTREILSKEFNENVKNLENYKKNLKILESEYQKIKSLRGTTKEEAQELINSRKLILFDIENLNQKIKLLENYVKKYSPFILNYGKYKKFLFLKQKYI